MSLVAAFGEGMQRKIIISSAVIGSADTPGRNPVVPITPEQIADLIEDWFKDGAADGFNLMPPVLPGMLDVFSAEVIPLLQRRGLFRTEYEGTTLREAALALGVSKWRTVLQIVVRTALKGIVTGVLLAIARVAGETAPLLFTAFGNLTWARNLGQPIAALPLQIFNYAMSPYDEWHRQAWAAALVLLLLVLFINIGVRFLTRDRWKGKI